MGDGTFKQVSTQNIATAGSFSAFGSMDANGDGLTDTYHAYSAAGIMTLELFLAQESGVFNPVLSKHSGMPTSYTFIGSMDFDGDGNDDVTQLWSNSGYISFVSYISEGDGTFRTITTGTSISLSGYLNTLPMDIDGDGRSDLLVVLSASSSIELVSLFFRRRWDFCNKGLGIPNYCNQCDVFEDGYQQRWQRRLGAINPLGGWPYGA